MAALVVIPTPQASIFDLGSQLAAILAEAAPVAAGEQLPEPVRERVADLAEALRHRVVRRPEKDLRTLFDLDDRLIELMDAVEESVEQGTEVSEALAQEIDVYLEAYRGKIDRIAGFWRWQESIAVLCGKEAERLMARKKAAENRITRLKAFLLAFMSSRGIRKLEGEKAAIGRQRNSQASLVIDDPAQIPARFHERTLRLNRTELEQLARQLLDGPLRQKITAELQCGAWDINPASLRAALSNNEPVAGARLSTGEHVRIR